MKRVLYFQELLYMPEIMETELISTLSDNSLAGYFGKEKIRELVTQKYY